MAPVSEYFIFNVTMNLIHIIIDALVSISLLRIAYARKNKVAYYLGMTGLTLCGTASLVLYFFIRGILLDQTLEVIGTSVVLNSIAILFLNRFINQLYTRPSEKTIRILTIFYLTFTIIIIIILTINIDRKSVV